MVEFTTVLLLAAATVAVAAVLGVVVVGALRLATRALSDPGRPVLPSHYSSLAYTDVSNYPGYCPECGTTNDPQFEVCKNCSARIPTRREREQNWDPEQVFGH